MPLSTTRISLPARRIIREAFEDLERTVSPVEAKDFEITTLQNVRQAALEVENVLAARRSLRNTKRLSPLFKGLEHYSQTIEVLCNGTPYLPWLWAPLKLILGIASDFVDAFERIIHAYSRIAESLSKFEILSSSLILSPDFQETLAIFYSDILRFHREAYVFVCRSGWQLLFLASWGRFQRRFDGILKDLKRHEELIDQTANAIDISEAAKLRDDLRAWRAESLSTLARQEEEEVTKQYMAITSWLKMDDSEQHVIFDSIAAEASKYPGTCDWILKQPGLRSWMRDDNDTPFLWLHGYPGTGKSVLATQIHTFLQADNRGPDTALVIRHFCTYAYASSTAYHQILRSLLLQLLQATRADLIAHVFEGHVMAKKPTTIPVLEQLFLSIGGEVGSVSKPSHRPYSLHIILDGLDECDAQTQDRTARILERLIAGTDPKTICKVLISSRSTPLLAKQFRRKQNVSLADERKSIRDAICAYAAQKLALLRPRLKELGFNSTDVKDVAILIANKADGMFLWARLVLEHLSSNFFYGRKEVLDAVDVLPRELSEFYGKILSQIAARLDTRSINRLRSILGWIAFAKRPLRMAEFRAALAFGDEGDTDVTEMPPKHIFDLCAPLIQEQQDTTFSFIHVSVRDYLQTTESSIVLRKQDAVSEHGLACITCLLAGFSVFSPAYDQQRRNERMVKGLHGLHMYATQNWMEYLLASAVPNIGLDESSDLFTKAMLLAKRTMTPAKRPATGSKGDGLHLDSRLDYLAHQRPIFDMIKTTLLDRSDRARAARDGLQATNQRETTTIVDPRDLSDLLANYQFSIITLLAVRVLPGVLPEELEHFKQEFRTSAFTCRVPMCPKSIVGFLDNRTRLDHELSHSQKITCTVPDCQHPPFPSLGALRTHRNKYHAEIQQTGGRTRIRKVAVALDKEVNSTVKDSLRPSSSATSAPEPSTKSPLQQSNLGADGPPRGQPAPMYKPEQMRGIGFLSDAEKRKYEDGLRILWKKYDNNPEGSAEWESAKKKIQEFAFVLAKKMRDRKLQAQAQQQAVVQQPRLSDTILKHLREVTFTAPANAPPEQAQKWQEDVKKRYANNLLQMETARAQMNKIDWGIKLRNENGHPLSPEEREALAERRMQIQKAFDNASYLVADLRKSQGNSQN